MPLWTNFAAKVWFSHSSPLEAHHATLRDKPAKFHLLASAEAIIKGMSHRGRAAPAFVLLAAVSIILPPVPGDSTILMDLHARTEFLYGELRRNPFTLDVLEDAIEQPALGLELEMRNPEGERYLCTMPGPGDEAAAGGDGKGDGSHSRSADSEGLLASSPARMLRSLEGRCDVLSLGWWSYEWCHRKGVRQFHVDHAVRY
jgi:hypothetical protein